jgi:hypothetical protein
LCGPRGPGVTPAAIQFPDVGSTSPTNAVATGKRLHPSREAARLRCPVVILFFGWLLELQVGSGPTAADRATPSRPNWERRRTTAECCTGGHTACFLVKRVDKPTDTLALLANGRCWEASRPPAVGPGAFPDPPPRAWGPRRSRRKYRSRAEGGTGRRHKTQTPKRHHEGD